jgi:SecD/SecF fusion protein
MGTKGLHLGIDYKSGTSITIISDKKITEQNIKDDLNKYKLDAREIDITEEETSIVLNDALSGEQVKSINKYLEETYNAKVNIGVVSNIVQKELVKNAIIAVLISLIGIILYISLRFKFSYAVGGVTALVHDVLVIFAVFAVTRLEVSSMFIAAVLAIIGYSINDTIIVFDRIREEIDKYDKKMDKEALEELTNKAIQNTFLRTIFTSVTTLIPILALIILGSSGILTFNIAMLVGLISGTYSSIFIASVVFMEIEKRRLGKPKKQKKIYKDDLEEMKVKGINC